MIDYVVFRINLKPDFKQKFSQGWQVSEIELVTKWLAIIGKWEFDATGSATYVTPQLGERPFGLCVSNYSLSEGEITFDFVRQAGEVDGRIVFGYKSPTEDYFAIGLGGYGHAYTLTHFSLARGWLKLVGVGQTDNLVAGRKYQLSIKIQGQNVLLEVDGVPAFNHRMASPIPYGQIGLFAWGESTANFSQVTLKRTSKDVEHVVVLVHGIRTFAEWQSMLKREFSLIGIAVAPTNYGYFDSFRFLAPVSWFSAAALNRLRILTQQVRADYPRAKISFLAHSFGTYLVSRFLQEEPNFPVHRVVFCGSVVRYDFPFEQIRNRFEAPVINEVSARDPWPLAAQGLTIGYGVAGTRGFNQPAVVDRWHKGFGHSRYLEQSFCKKYWLPFFSKGIVVESEHVASKPPIWIRLLGFLANKYFLAALIAVLIALWPFIWIEDRTPAPNQRSCADIRKSTSADWRAENMNADQDGTFYVIVRSITRFKDYPFLNRIVGRMEAYRLARQFPTVSFDLMPTAGPDGGNEMQAIVLARAIPDRTKACKIRQQAAACRIADDAYVYQLGKKPIGCSS